MTFPSTVKNLLLQLVETLLLLSCSGLIAWGCSPTASQPQNSTALAAAPAPTQALALKRTAALADSMANLYVNNKLVPGMSIAIAQQGVLVFSGGYGMADVEQGVAASPETIFGITSISKQFAAAAILKLVEQGKISLQEPISTYLPDYPLQGHVVRVSHLLNHTSGISAMRATSAIADKDWFAKDLNYQEMVKLFGEQPFEFEPGQQRAYNNFAYYLLGEIISRVSGMPYENYIEQKMLQPLGLQHTRFCDANRSQPNSAKPYLAEDKMFTPAPHVSRFVLGPAGAMCSTVEELVRWTHLLHQGMVVSQNSLQQMLAPTVLANGDTSTYGYGLFVEALGEHQKVFHGGTQPWGSYLTHYPESGLTIAVLTNAGGAGRKLAEEMEEVLAREALAVKTKDIALSQEALSSYKGDFVLQAGSRSLDVRVFMEEGKLMAQATGQKASPLLYQGNHAFTFAVDDKIRLVFSVEQGQAVGFTLFQNGREIQAKRKP